MPPHTSLGQEVIDRQALERYIEIEISEGMISESGYTNERQIDIRGLVTYLANLAEDNIALKQRVKDLEARQQPQKES